MTRACNYEESSPVEILLTRGYIARVDALDADLIAFKWHTEINRKRDTVYAVRTDYGPHGQRDTIRLHRIILSRILRRELLPTEKVDHIDRNGLNCQRANLRLATNAENSRNQKRRSSNTSGYKGVSWYKPSQKWMAKITINGTQMYLGYFDSPQDAYDAYCDKAKELFGEFARLD